jgi:DNA-binding LytR/AlgR family response regulator
VAAGDLLFIESQDNDVEVVAMQGETLSRQLIRSSLKRIESMAVPGLIRCHRSYIVNIARVRQCYGNRHGLSLHLHGTDRVIPVSRSHTEEVYHALQAGILD